MSKPFDDNSTRNAERVSKRDRGISAPKPERRYMDAIKMILASGHIELVETIAERLAELVLRHERVQALTVQVEKLDVAPGAVGIRIRRERQAETAKVHNLFPGLPDAAEPER